MSQGSPHRSRRKDSTQRDGSGSYSRNVGSKSSNPTKSSSLATKSDKAGKGRDQMNGSGSGGSGSGHEIKVSRSPQSYNAAVSNYRYEADNEYEEQQGQGPSNRTHYISMNLIGQQVRAVLKDGTVYEGLFHNPIFDRGFGVVLHMARKKEGSDSGLIRTPPIDQVTIQPHDLVMLDAPEVAFVEDSAEFKKKMMREGFRTDTEISARDFSERELVPWLPPEEAGSMGGLEDEASGRNRWDQFEANERLFGVRTSYDERVYTTDIDRQRVSREVVEKAIRIEREIKFQTTSNPHLAEERGIVAPKDDTEDEEDKYSSVLRDAPKGGAKNGKDKSIGVGGKKKQDEREKAREHELRKQRQREMEIEREREREREKEKEREKARQKERERLERERAAKGLPPSSPSAGLRSHSTTSIANLADEAMGKVPSSPPPSKLGSTSPFRQRSYSMSNITAAAPGSPANLDPDDPQYLEKLRFRQNLAAEMRSHGVEPRAAPEKLKVDPYKSPIVGHPEQIKSLDLSPAVPRVSESVLHEFQQYKERKRSLSNASPAVPTKHDLVNFSKEIEKKTSAPNSPALKARRGEHQIAPSPLSPRHVLDATAAKLEKEGGEGEKLPPAAATTPPQSTTATPFSTPSTATPAAESPASSSAATTPRGGAQTAAATLTTGAAQQATAAESTEKPAAVAGSTESQPPLSKIQLPSLKSKLNPFAKAFTPKKPAPATPATESKPAAGSASPASAGRPTVDINIPVSSFFAQGMRRLLDNPEDPEQVTPVWPHGRVPYRQEDGMPIEGAYPYPPVPGMSMPPGGPRPMGYPVPYVTSPPPQMGSGQPVMMFPPGQPVPRGFVPQGSIPGGPGVAYYGGPGGQPYPPHLYSAPPPGAVPGAGPSPGGPMVGHKGRMGPGAYPPPPGGPHGHVPPPHSPHAPPHSPQQQGGGSAPRAGGPPGGASPGGAQAIPPMGGSGGYTPQFPPNSPPPYGVPPGEHGAPPHSPHAQPASPHSPHAPRAQPHMVSPTQPIYSFPPGAPHILGDPLAVPPGRGPHPQQPMVVQGMAPRGGYRYMQQGPGGPPPQMRGGEFMNPRPEGGAPNKSPAQAQPFHPRQGNPNAGAFFPGQQQQQQQQRGPGQQQQRGGASQHQQQDKDGGQRFKVPNTDVLPQQ